MAINPAMLAPLLEIIKNSGGANGAATNMMNNAFSSQALTGGVGGGVGGGGAGMGMSAPRVNGSGAPPEPIGEMLGSRISGIGDALANMPMWETQLQPFTAPYQGPAVGPAGFNPGEAALLALMQRISAGGR